jgi:hypothetical protein
MDEPRLDASRPSNLRLAGFALTAGGALLMGIGSVLTWVTVGIADQFSVQTVSPGTDLSGGVITLVCAVVVLVLVVVSRFVPGTVRRWISVVVIVAGAVASAVAGYFIWAAPTHYSPVDDQRLVDAIATARADHRQARRLHARRARAVARADRGRARDRRRRADAAVVRAAAAHRHGAAGRVATAARGPRTSRGCPRLPPAAVRARRRSCPAGRSPRRRPGRASPAPRRTRR